MAVRFIDYVRLLSGQKVDVLVRGINLASEEEGGVGGLSGRMVAGEDFVAIQSTEEGLPTVVRIEDIILIQLAEVPACTCGEHHGPQEEQPEPKTTEADRLEDINLEQMLWEWEREKGNLES